jgi:hypothetical protein
METSSYEHGVTISPTAVRFDEYTMWVDLTDGRTIGVPLAWFPRLLNATEQERQQVELSRLDLHWEQLDEDISVVGRWPGATISRFAPPICGNCRYRASSVATSF